MTKKYHFITGLPRSGSTLLSAILRQNPKFSASISSPVVSLLLALMLPLSSNGEFAVFLNNEIRKRVLRGVVDNFYEDNPARVIFDTNRMWTQKLPVMLELFSDCRFICCVRSLPDILQSFETLYLRNPLQISTIVGQNATSTVFSRIDTLLAPTGLIGGAINGMKEAFYGPNSDRLIFVPYETLVARPEAAMQEIYHFIGEKPFKHDFAKLEFSAPDYDRPIGAPGLHDVRPKLAVAKQARTIPPEIVNRYVGTPFWAADRNLTKANVKLV
jgi:sulfotransferase